MVESALPGSVRTLVQSNSPRERLESVSKKRKVEETVDNAADTADEVFELTNVTSGEKWTRVVKKGKKKETPKEETPQRRESVQRKQKGLGESL